MDFSLGVLRLHRGKIGGGVRTSTEVPGAAAATCADHLGARREGHVTALCSYRLRHFKRLRLVRLDLYSYLVGGSP